MALQKANDGNGTPFKFEKAGDVLKGYYLGQVKKLINGSPAIEHSYKTSSGIRTVLGQANLLKQYETNGVTPGTYVEITFTGEKKKLDSRRQMKVYELIFDLDNRDLTSLVVQSSMEVLDEEEEDQDEDQVTSPKLPSAERQNELKRILSTKSKLS